MFCNRSTNCCVRESFVKMGFQWKSLDFLARKSPWISTKVSLQSEESNIFNHRNILWQVFCSVELFVKCKKNRDQSKPLILKSLFYYITFLRGFQVTAGSVCKSPFYVLFQKRMKVLKFGNFSELSSKWNLQPFQCPDYNWAESEHGLEVDFSQTSYQRSKKG